MKIETRKKRILFVFGTRPEAIKLAPLISCFKDDASFDVKICSTGQHSQMLHQVLDFFQIKVDYDFKLMKENQSLSTLTCDIINHCSNLFSLEHFDGVIVQGDTTTVMSVSLAAFYAKIPLFHIEAGLRTGDKYSPFPEEINRQLASRIADCHFCPTDSNVANLVNEGITSNVYKVGNTVIDAVLMGIDRIRKNPELIDKALFSNIDFNKKLILLTAHRRENFGEPLKEIFKAINDLAIERDDLQFIYPVHLNPNVRKTAHQILTANNIFLFEPFNYQELIFIMSESYMILTDSGGIQEEAPSLNKPVLILRDVTERMEAVENGNAILVGTDYSKITTEVKRILDNKVYYESFSQEKNPYGDGHACERILNIIKDYFNQNPVKNPI